MHSLSSSGRGILLIPLKGTGLLTACPKELTQSLWAWGVTGRNERTDGARTGTFDVQLVIELQIDVFDVSELG